VAEAAGQLQTRDRQLAEAQEQQTATSEILRVISSSPNDAQPVFDAIATSALRLLGGLTASVVLVRNGVCRLGAFTALDEAADAAMRNVYPRPLSELPLTQAIVDDGTARLVEDVESDERMFQPARDAARARGYRSLIMVPLVRDGVVIGTINVSHREARAFGPRPIALLQTFADQAVIAIENVRLFTELQASNRELTTALDTQTATSDILRVISRSQMDVQPVFDSIVAAAVRLLGAYQGVLTRIVGDEIHHAASTFTSGAEDPAVSAAFPRSLHAEGTHAQAIRDRVAVNIADAQTDPALSEERRALARARGYRSLTTVPLLRHGEALGTIAVTRREAGGFTDDEIALLQTFADQAVIAIENVRLFKELQEKNGALTESLEQQTATSEILRAISEAQTDAQPVFDAIARSTVHLCNGARSTVWRPEGDLLRCVARYEMTPEGRVVRASSGETVDTDSLVGRAVRERQILRVGDATESPAVPVKYRERARTRGYRSLLAVPMVHEGLAVGGITVVRPTASDFSDQEVQLVKTFADQAVIAIENVRLFTELETRNRDLTEALDRQTATAEILRVISRSQTEVQPVFEAIVDNAMRLFRAWAAAIVQSDGQLLHLIAVRGGRPELDQYLREQSPWSIHGPTPVARSIVQRTVIHVPDTELDRFEDEAIREIRRRGGMRSILAAPMLRNGQPIGGIWVARAEAGSFSPTQIALLQTFADQAVIAIENARLLSELQERTQELTRSVDQLTALGEVGRAVSSTLDLETVLTTIVSRAVELSGLDEGVVFEYDEGEEAFVQRAATEQQGGRLAEARRTTRVRKGEGVVGRTALTLEPTQVADITVPGAYESRTRENLIASGVRALLAVPMVREDRLIGTLVVARYQPGTFADGTIDLLRTFATQSALAIQNARLFREIEDKSRQLEVASQHKSEFLANMSHELRTPLNAIIGFSEVLSERMFGELNDKQAEYLKDIYASGQHLLSLINDILDLSKIEAGRMELELTDFHLPTALDNALTLVRERAGRRGIALELAVDERLGEIRADERKIRQVVLNLLSNAIKFTPEGGRIEVRAAPMDGSVEVSVTDTGVGIAPEDQEAIFEEFKQVGTAAKKVEGTGLGLALSRKFIELHGGRIWVKSTEGVGSTFTFTIPLQPGQ